MIFQLLLVRLRVCGDDNNILYFGIALWRYLDGNFDDSTKARATSIFIFPDKLTKFKPHNNIMFMYFHLDKHTLPKKYLISVTTYRRTELQPISLIRV